MSIIEFFESNSYLSQSIDLFDSCMFLYAPEDIMKEFYFIHLIFAGYVATKMKINIDDEIVLDGVQFLWKLLFIISSIPNINGVISFVQKYMSYDCYPKILFGYASILIVNIYILFLINRLENIDIFLFFSMDN